jgi:hypothetical protein
MCWCNLYGVSKNQIELRVAEFKRRNSININPNTSIHNYDDKSYHEDLSRDETFALFKKVVGPQQGSLILLSFLVFEIAFIILYYHRPYFYYYFIV